MVGLVGFGLNVIQGALQKANAVRLAWKGQADIEKRYCVLAKRTVQLSTKLKELDISVTRIPAGTPAGTGDELVTLKDLVRENITEAGLLLEELASKIPQHGEHLHDGSKAVNDCGGEGVADGSEKRKGAEGPSKWTKLKMKGAVKRGRNAVVAAFNVENVSEKLESADKLFLSAIELTAEIRTILRAQAILGHNESIVENTESILENTESILNRWPNPRHDRDEFSAFFDAPSLPSTHVYDFESRDHNGARSSPEGRLLDAVLRPGTGEHTHGASALGTHGMGGVGKTTALKRICRDEEVRRMFTDGVCFLEFGQDATDEKFMGELVRFVSNSGGSNAVEEMRLMRSAGKLGDVIDRAAEWIKGRVVLLVCDDLWVTKSSELGYVHELRRLLRNAPQSRLLCRPVTGILRARLLSHQ